MESRDVRLQKLQQNADVSVSKDDVILTMFKRYYFWNIF